MQIGEHFIAVRPDTSGFDRELAADVERAGQGAANKLRNVLTFGAAAAGAKVMTDAASDLQQAVGGTAAVFGEASTAVDEFAESAADAVGLSERSARELTTRLGGALKGLGFEIDDAADKSIQLTELGADLAATYGGTTAEAVETLGAAFRGEFDSAERFNLFLSQSKVDAEAVRLGLADTTTEVDSYARAQATLSLIMEQSADAQGQFAREADTAAGQTAIAQAKAEDAAASLGENLLPIYTRLTELVGDVAGAFEKLPTPVQTAVLALGGIALLSGPISSVLATIKSLGTIGAGALDRLASGAYSAAGGLDRMGAAAFGASGKIAPIVAVATTVMAVLDEMGNRAPEHAESFADAMRQMGDAAEGATSYMVDAFASEGPFADAMREAGMSWQDLADAALGTEDEWRTFRDAVLDAGAASPVVMSQLGGLGESIETIGSTLDNTRGDVRAAADEFEAWEDLQGPTASATDGAVDPTNDLAGALDNAASSAADATAKLLAYRDLVDGIISGNLDVEEATDAYQEALQALNDRLAENGGVLEGSSEAARDNRDAFRDVVEAGGDLVTALEDAGTASEDILLALYFQQIALAETAEGWGVAADDAQRYLDVLAKLPTSPETWYEQVPGIYPSRPSVTYADGGATVGGYDGPVPKMGGRGGVTIVNRFDGIPLETAAQAAADRMAWQLTGRDGG